MDIISYPSPNFDQRSRSIDTVVIHYTDMLTPQAALERLSDPEARVSAHYLISERGEVFQLVQDKDRAWHAGVSSWKGVERLNDNSLGIELANPGHSNEYQPFPHEQMTALMELCHALTERHQITYILGHSDIAPMRKKDPGELFNWSLLAEEGLGIWPKAQNFKFDIGDLSESKAIQLLEKIGYGFNNQDDQEVEAVFLAFQRHFVQNNLTGKLDLETWKILNAVSNTIDNIK